MKYIFYLIQSNTLNSPFLKVLVIAKHVYKVD